MDERRDLLERIDRLSALPSHGSASARLLSEIEDVLAEGYIEALTREARSRRLGQRLEQLVDRIDDAEVAGEARRLAGQRRSLDRRNQDLRARLAVMQTQFVQLGGGRTVGG
jgi:hypothetical protein